MGSSAVNVGTLTSTALYTSISSALAKICPTVGQTSDLTHCSTDEVAIGNIDYTDGNDLERDGELTVRVKSSQYNVTSLRGALIDLTAKSAQYSSSGKNCHDQQYELRRRKRWWHPFVPRSLPLVGRYLQQHQIEHITFCNSIDFAGAHYYSPYVNVDNIGTATDYIDAEFSFHKGPEADLDCDFINELIDGLALIQPEFAVEDVELGSAIGALCKQDEDD